MGYQLELGTIKAHKAGNRIFSYYATEEEGRESGLGRVFIVLEILSKDKNLVALGPELIAVLKDNFFHSPSSNIEASLELACQKANKFFLSEPIDHYKLYSKISGVVFAIHEDQLSLTHIHNGSLLLLRKNKINAITEPQSVKVQKDDKPKLFSSITTGVLEAGDILLGATRPLTDFFGDEKLKSILKQLKVPDAALAFTNEIQTIPSIMGFEAIVAKVGQKAQSEEVVVPEKLIENASVQSSMKGLQSLESKTSKLLSLSSWNLLKKKTTGAILSVANPTREKIVSGIKDLIPSKQEEAQKKTDPSRDRSILPAKLSQEVFRNPFEKIRSLFQSKNRYLGIGIVLLLLFIATTIVQTKGLGFSSPNNTFLDAARESLTQAETSLIYQNEQSARQQLESAKDSLASIGKKENDDTRAIAKQIDELERRLYLIVETKPESFIDFSKQSESSATIPQSVSLFSYQNKLFSFATSPLRMLATNLSNQSFSEIPLEASLASFNASLVAADTKGIFASDKTTIHYFDLNDKTILLSGPFPASQLTAYAERLYVISGDLIYRIDKQKNELSRTLWISDGTTIPGARSIAIDGDVYVGTDSGVVKYSKGKRQAFSLPALGVAITADALVTSLESKYLFILDSNLKRIVIIEKSSGTLTKQLALADLPAPPTSFVVDEIKKIIYLKAGNAIWKAGF